ncbi:MAG: FGGY-family carbohydrate kinase [Acetivibrionales bacterium]|jgi:sugar (pentulose or hexulose) kinase
MLFMGIDVGTQGVRAIAANEAGKAEASASVSFHSLNLADIPGHYEQSPETWWNSTAKAIVSVVTELKNKGFKSSDIVAISIDGTSGTILPIGKDNRPLLNGIMYNDMRSKAETDIVRSLSASHEEKMGLRFNSSFALPKILWIKNNMPNIYENARLIIHQADYIAGKLCGEYGVSDYSNSLKTGYDLIDNCWPEYIEELGLDRTKLPDIVAPGEVIGKVSKEAAEELGLSTDTRVVAGATDGYASALAAGAVHVGSWATIIGTTLVLKGVSQYIMIDKTGGSYCHKLPSGSWMVGGASNVGGHCLNNRFDKDQFKFLDQSVEALSPTGVLIYPLTGKGERYPFVDPDAQEFIVGDISDERVLYTALMEGVGYVERLSYDLSIRMGCTIGDVIYTSGGACRSDGWLRIRASIMNRAMKVPAVVDAAMGSAMLAASKTCYSNLEQAADNMITFAKTVEPVKEKVKIYDELYFAFYEECKKRFKLGGQQ